ncbi:MAG: phytoene/squalene synthase family protein [Pirellulales bacterium]
MSSSASGPAAGESIRRHSRSFSFASRLLPASKRSDVERLYAWCRWCDDGVDAAASPQEALEFVERATQDIRRIAAGESPIADESRWLADLVGRHELPLGAALALLEGMRSDLTPAAGFHEADLLRYCFRVAGAVGVLLCPILGLEDRRHLPHAAALGMGMQLTNIARDVAEDWQRSRCYLPVEWTDGLQPGAGPPDPQRVQQGVRTILEVADGYYMAGEAGIGGLDRDSRLAVRAAARIYHAIGTRIRQRDFQVLDERARVSTLRKLRLLALAMLVPTGAGRRIKLDDPARRALATAEQLLSECRVSCEERPLTPFPSRCDGRT